MRSKPVAELSQGDLLYSCKGKNVRYPVEVEGKTQEANCWSVRVVDPDDRDEPFVIYLELESVATVGD